MELNEKEYWYWFVNINRIGRLTRNRLLSIYNTPKDIFHADPKEIRSLDWLTETQKNNIITKNVNAIKKGCMYLKQKNIHMAHINSPLYPDRLMNIPDKPHVLYYRGMDINKRKQTVAIVGSRRCSDYGRRTAYNIARELAGYGIDVISGLAYGIDSAAHKGCLEGNGVTAAVLGCGVNVCYPQSNIELFYNISERGSIISEYHPDTSPIAGYFPERNRIISGLADILVIVEAGERSGSLITVDCALEQGKDIFAVPGRIDDVFSKGCNELIKMGAQLCNNCSDILEYFDIAKNENKIAKKEKEKISLDIQEKILYACLCFEPKHINLIAKEADMDIEQAIRIIFNLERKNIIRQTTGNYYVKV